ncbi:MAG: CsbD family protein [Solirubrobacteraceae bacterium]|nr:CsbD family protein [Solirubrobacteraceae bacterium]
MDIKGKLKETTGKATGNDRLKHEGQAEQAVDKLKDAAGAVTEKVKDVLKSDK